KRAEGKGFLTSPFQDTFIQISGVATPRLRVLLRASYTHQTLLNYSGVGNASPAPVPENAPNGSRSYFQYSWTHPELAFGVRVELSKPWFVLLRQSYTQTFVSVPVESKLRDDSESGGPASSVITGIGNYGVYRNDYALLYDDRDDEIDPQSGQYHQIGQS